MKMLIMKNDLISVIKNFIDKEKINLSISKDTSSDFWLDNKDESVTMRLKINTLDHEILYDVYSPKFLIHLREKTIRDVERNEYIAEEKRQWTMSEIIEDMWLILDKVKLWAMKHNFSIKEKKLI